MNITVKSSKVAKTGKNEKGEWSLIVVTADDRGIEYTTFDKKAHIGPGAVLDIGEPDVKDGKFSFKKCTVVSEGAGPKTSPANGKSEMSPDQWAERDRLEQLSREANACYMGLPALIQATTPDKGLQFEAKNAALKWALDHFNGKPVASITKTSEAPKTDKDWDGLGKPTFKDLGDFLTKTTKALDITTDEICVRLSKNKVQDISDFAGSWAILTAK